MHFWRICRRAHQRPDGEGARLVGGRWNAAGRPMVYCSLNLSLAALEVLVHLREEELPDDYVAQLFLSRGIPTDSIERSDLPSDWQTPHGVAALQRLGDDWLLRGNSAILVVPSVIIPEEANVLVNPGHRNFDKLKVRIVRPFVFDVRLLHGNR